ncbi:SprT-like domain-containing protein [Spirosoma rigui]|uniref:SprT-like domain-containing protein n=1 Tax=Spirosoma rigui TaxID=564064 RepID=UPI0009B0B6D1|nr:SprT-like domain-containing protein [Spirosoma rigui]
MTDLFDTYLPAASAAYGRTLWHQYRFTFRVVKPRRTRLGDFRVLPEGDTFITVNADLNPHAFLITYIHEVAHAAVHQTLRKRGKPHGRSWQTAFQRLMQPLLTEAVFPAPILEPLRNYMARPAATTSASPALMLALRQTDPTATTEPAQAGQVLLRDVREGQSFRFAKKTYVRGTMRRTRVVCKEVVSGRSYAILAHALVDVSE